MSRVPKPRKPGQTGGGGRHGQAGNRGKSHSRGGNPYRGGGGQGKKPAGKSSASAIPQIKAIGYTLFVGLPLAVVALFVWVGVTA